MCGSRYQPDYEFSDAPPALVQDALLQLASPPDIAADITALSATLGATATQFLTSGEVNTSFDAGVYIAVIVGGVVWDDLNGDGINDAGEPTLGGTGITIVDNENNFMDFVVSDVNGTYSLTLPPGSYYGIIFPPGPEYVLTPQVEGGSDFDPDTMQTDVVTLLSNETGVGSFDAGFYQPATINAFVWEDAMADGVQDAGEVGYTDPMIIYLYLASDLSTPVQNTTTGAGGAYTLEDVPPGSYIVEFVPQAANTAFSPAGFDSEVDPATGRAP